MLTTQLNTPAFIRLTDGFEKLLKEEGKSKLFINEHFGNAKEFLHYAERNGCTAVSSLGQKTVDQYMEYLTTGRKKLRGTGMLSNGSINKRVMVVRKLWKYMQIERIPVPSVRLKQLKKKLSREIIVLSINEVQQLYSVTDNTAFGFRDRAALACMYGCGMRKGEVLQLRTHDVDFNKSRIYIRGNVKNSHERYAVMTNKVKEDLQRYIYSYRDFYLQENSGVNHIFISERGSPLHPESLACRIEGLWERVKTRYGSNKPIIGCHTLRHSAGTHLYMQKVPLEKIALLLGHRCMDTVKHYVHWANLLTSK